MKVGTKLTAALAIPIVALIAGFGYLDIRRTSQRYHEELKAEGRAITRTVQLAMEDALRDRQLADVQELVDQIAGFERVLGLRLFGPDGSMTYQSSTLKSQTSSAAEALGKVLATRQPAETRREVNGQKVVTFIVPLSAPNGSLYGAVQLFQLESFIDEDARSTRNSILALTIAMILVTGLTVILVTRLIVTRPVDDMVAGIRAIRPGEPGVPESDEESDEFARLGREFNALRERLDVADSSLRAEQAERRQTELRLRSAERLAALGQLAAGLAHEIGTPLNVIGGRTDLLLRRQLSGEPLEKNLRIISGQINRIARIVREMLQFAQVKEPNLVPAQLSEVLAGVLEFVGDRLEQAGVRLEVTRTDHLPTVLADPDQIYEVFLNLVMNAVDAMDSGGLLHVDLRETARTHVDRGQGVQPFLVVEFADSGAGIRPEYLDRIFDPFFTTKGVGRGSGLGLSVSYGIVREHGGWIDVESENNRGTRVTVYLPVTSSPASTAPREAGATS